MNDGSWAALHLDWRGETLYPDGEDTVAGGPTRIRFDGNAHIVNGRLVLAATPDFTVEPSDYKVIDTATGFYVACRGTAMPQPRSGTVPSIVVDDYEVIFGRDWLHGYGGLWGGGVVLCAKPPRNVPKFAYRARQTGEDLGKGLFMCRPR